VSRGARGAPQKQKLFKVSSRIGVSLVKVPNSENLYEFWMRFRLVTVDGVVTSGKLGEM
jgi:hypothetical protein